VAIDREFSLVTAILLAMAAPIVRSQETAAPVPQATQIPEWQSAAGGKRAFEVASVKPDNGPFRPPNFPLDNGNSFTPGARFSADFPLLTYIQFAYKVHFSQQQRESMLAHAHLPKWFESDRFAIEAKAAGPVTKDQMRLMMQALLADRFGLAVHFETQETAVMALTLVKPGKTGPKLRPHSEGPACEESGAPAAQGRAGDASRPFPERCYVQELRNNGRQLRAGSRNTTMDQLAEVLSALGPPFAAQSAFHLGCCIRFTRSRKKIRRDRATRDFRLWCKLESGTRLTGLFRIECPRWGQAASAALHSSDMVALRILSLSVLNWPFLDLLRQLDSANVTARDRAHWYLISVAPDARKPQSFDTPYRVDTLVNIKDWCKNSFEVVKQLRINTDNSHHRYNVILLINGITAIQIELKTLGIRPRRSDN
jgi:uncharacterized protein (TIGR03435 family)